MLLLKDCPVWTDWLGVLLVSVIFLLLHCVDVNDLFFFLLMADVVVNDRVGVVGILFFWSAGGHSCFPPDIVGVVYSSLEWYQSLL